MTFEEARALFPALERVAYLNAGSMGPLAIPMFETMQGELRRQLEEGRGGLPFFERMVELRAGVREQLAGLLGVAQENLALTTSTTEACNIVLSGLDLGPQDEILTSATEHFGLLGALQVSGASIRVAPDDGIVEAVTDRTRLIAISHVSWMTGNSLEPARVKEQTGLPILVDGAQSVGAIPVDASAFDYYTVSCQKWLCGPDATGGLYVRDPEALRIAWPSYFSQEKHERDGTFQPWPTAARFDPAWIPPASLAGLLAALGLAAGMALRPHCRAGSSVPGSFGGALRGRDRSRAGRSSLVPTRRGSGRGVRAPLRAGGRRPLPSRHRSRARVLRLVEQRGRPGATIAAL